MMSIRNAFCAGAEATQHSAITMVPAVLGESLQDSTMGTRISLKPPSCKSLPVITFLSLAFYEMEVCILNIYMAILTLKRGK